MDDQLTFEDHDDDIKLRNAWPRVIEDLRGSSLRRGYERYLENLRPRTLRDGIAQIDVAGTFSADFIRKHLLERLEECLSERLSHPIAAQLNVVAEERRLSSGPELASSIRPATPVAARPAHSFTPEPRFRFDTYITGQENRLACAAARRVAAEPGQKYNPLFIFGKSGYGKTHLMHAIAHEIRETDPNASIMYLTAQQFAEGLIQAIQSKRVDSFRKNFRSVQVWLVDDIQFLINKDRTAEEVFYIFNELQSSRKQVVLCSDRAPRDLYGVDERLRSRFESGLVADIQEPDTETRCAILRSKAEQMGTPIPMDIALFYAEKVEGSIRSLEGALTKLLAHASILGLPLTMELAEQIVKQDYSTQSGKKLKHSQIVQMVSREFGVGVDDIRGQSRKADIVQARQAAIYVARELTSDSYSHIARAVGNRDHTTLIHGYKAVTIKMAKDEDYKMKIQSIMQLLRPEESSL